MNEHCLFLLAGFLMLDIYYDTSGPEACRPGRGSRRVVWLGGWDTPLGPNPMTRRRESMDGRHVNSWRHSP